MITCKEDLVGFYALRSDKEVFELFMGKCEDFELKWRGASSIRDLKHGEAVTFNHNYAKGFLGQNAEAALINDGLKKLTLSDFKPTRTEYVKVEGSIFDLKPDFEAGELYFCEFSAGRKFVKIGAGAEHLLMGNLSAGNVYRKVEREITWQDEIKRLYPVNAIDGHVSFKQLITDEQFIEMCHKVYNLTK